jgi:hypothetical protein
MFTNGWKNSKKGVTTMLMMRILSCEQPQHVMRLRSGYIGLSGTTEKPKLIILHLELASDLQSTREKLAYGPNKNKRVYCHSVRKILNHRTKLIKKQQNYIKCNIRSIIVYLPQYILKMHLTTIS